MFKFLSPLDSAVNVLVGLLVLVDNLFDVKAKGQYWPLTCNTNHNTMFDMQAVNI